MEKSVTCDETLKAEILWALKAIMSHYSYKSCKGMEGKTGQKWNGMNLYQTAWCIISYHVVTYPAKQQTSRWTDIPYPIHRVIVSDMPLHRTVCCCIVPGAAKLSSVCGDRVWVIPQNCSLFCYIILDETIFWAECDVTVTNRPLHRPLCCYIALSDATLWAVCQDMLTAMPLHRPLCCYIVGSYRNIVCSED